MQERATEKTKEVGSSLGQQNWSCHMNDSQVHSPWVRYVSTAVSSGFPSPAKSLPANIHSSVATTQYFHASSINDPQYFY